MTNLIMNKTTYRPDIDSLRCIAVVGVILFHFDSAYLPGGFTGVDIFFVISGYLITGVVYAELRASTFTFVEFYRRRIKRILPPMLLMVFVSLIAGQFIFLPSDFKELSEVSIYSLFSVVNIFYAYVFDASYFSPGVEYQPLLHLWSLGIEEQFYLIWPAMLFLFYKISNQTLSIGLLSLAIVSSYLYAEYLLGSNVEFSYYLLPSRAGELLVGASMVFVTRNKSVQNFISNKIMSGLFLMLGVMLVLYSYTFISESDGFPGLSAIAPVLGASLIILSGISTLTILHRPLIMRPFVYLGLISYPLYLWHWPILAYFRYMFGELAFQHELMCVVLTLLFSVFSYHILEAYCRKSKVKFNRILLTQFVLPAALILMISSIAITTSGFGLYKLGSYEEQYNSFGDSLKPAGRQSYMCKSLKSSPRYFRKENCTVNAATTTNAILWGDSHAQHYVGILGEIAKEHGFSFSIATHQACLPILHESIVFSGKKQLAGCKQSLVDIIGDLDDIEVILLAGAWSTHYKNHGQEFVAGLNKTVRFLNSQNKKVVLLGELPRIKNYDRLCNLKSLKLKHIDCDERMVGSRQASDKVNEPLKQLAENNSDVIYFEPHNVLCNENLCNPYLGNELLYYDSGHLSFNGSVTIGRFIADLDKAPEFLDLLPTTENKVASVVPWDRLVKVKIESADYTKNEIPSSWEGQSETVNNETVIFDRSDNSVDYGYVNVRNIVSANDEVMCSDRVLHISYSFDADQINNISMLALRISNKENGDRDSYTLWIDHYKQVFLAQGLANDNNSYARIDKSHIDAYYQIPKILMNESAQLLLYPSAGSDLMRMKKASVGFVKDITLNAYCKPTVFQ